MPDLDEVLATLVADVGENTRAPGAANAIERAQRRRARTTAAAAVIAVAAIAVGSALAAGPRSTSDQPSPIKQPTPSPTTASKPAVPGSFEELDMILARAAARVPGWGVAENAAFDDDAFHGSCSGYWSDRSIGGGSDGLTRFRSKAQASDAAAMLAENLTSCTKTAWRTHPIGQTGATLASSPGTVAWIVPNGTLVSVYQLATTDGPPPVDVQLDIVEWSLHRKWSD